MLKRFAVVKDWENTVSAEEECINRIVNGAAQAGVVCDVVDTSYRLIHNRQLISSSTHDFVLHIHYCSGKAENVFSFATLWNPIKFFHDWGYRKSADTLMTNDAFLQSGSEETIRQIKRLTFEGTFHPLSFPFLFPSPATSLFEPNVKEDYKLMYCGINWEKLTGKKGRFDDLLKKLDDENLISIYGPRVFHGIKPWEGYKNYCGEIPFDGVSMLKEISKCGIALVISSENHIRDEIISNRLFEALAAGAIVIADKNPAVKKLIGDNCLYIDTKDLNSCFSQIVSHLNWIKNNKDKALLLARNAQDIFNRELSTKVCIQKLYDDYLPKLKEKAKEIRTPESTFSLSCFYLIEPESDLNKQVSLISNSIAANQHPSIKHFIVCGSDLKKEIKIDGAEIIRHPNLQEKPLRTGELLQFALNNLTSEFFSVILPGEELFDDHFISVVKAIKDNNTLSGSSDLIVKRVQPDSISFIGLRWNEICHTTTFSGSFVHSSKLIDTQTISTITQLSNCFSFMFALKAGEIACSKGFTLKLHEERSKSSYELETLRDLRKKDLYGFFCQSPIFPFSETRLRRFYNKFYKQIAPLKKFPFVWSSLKFILKRYL